MLYAVLCPKACQSATALQRGQPGFQLAGRDAGRRTEQRPEFVLLIPFVRSQQAGGLLRILFAELVQVGEVEHGHLAAPLEHSLQGTDVVLDQGDVKTLLQLRRGGIEIGDPVVIAGDADQPTLLQVLEEGLIPARCLERNIDLAAQQQGPGHAYLIRGPVPAYVLEQHEGEATERQRLVAMGGRGGHEHEVHVPLDLVEFGDEIQGQPAIAVVTLLDHEGGIGVAPDLDQGVAPCRGAEQ